MNGDILSLIDYSDLYQTAISSGAKLTVTVKKEITPYAFGNIFFDDDLVTGIQEKPDIVMHILAGIYVMSPEIFRFIPENEYYGMDSLIKKMLNGNEPITKYDLNEYWLDIGRINDYETAQDAYKTHFSEQD